MFERLGDRFNAAFKSLSGRGKITEGNVRESLEDVRDALLEADVHRDVVDEFIDNVLEQARGDKVLDALKPGQQMIGIVHQALIDLMKQGDDVSPGLPRVSPGPSIVMMCGLQGSGKTTTCGKLAGYLKKRGRSVMLAAADLQRPAAVDQLETVTHAVNAEIAGGPDVRFYAEPEKVAAYGQAVGAAVEVCRNAVKRAKADGIDTIILDTAGRLHIDDALMSELRGVKLAVNPTMVLLIVDAMTGQDAVNSAKAFHDQLSIDGVVLTKFDSDARGGAALTVRKVTGAPIRFVGTGEHLNQIEEFHPDRVAGRILGMGDVVSLVEKAQEEVSEQEAEEMARKMSKGELTMDDFLSQMRTLRRMGPMKQILGMLPGIGGALKDFDIDEKQLDRVEGMVRSMTPEERRDVNTLNNSRRKRIANGSGTRIEDVSRLTRQFDMISKMTRQMSGTSTRDKVRAMKALQAGGSALPGVGAMPGFGAGKGTTKSRSPKRGFKQRKKRR